MIKAQKKTLLSAITAASQIVNKRNTIPILANIALTVTGTELAITGSDLDVEIGATCAVEAEREFSITAPADTLKQIVSKLDEDSDIQIAADLEKSTLTIWQGRSRFTLSTLPIDDFPFFGESTFDVEFEVDAIPLLEAMAAVSFAISTEETRYYLNGIFAHAPDKQLLFMVATNGHTLARRAVRVPDDFEAGPFSDGVIIPRRTIEAIRKNFSATAKLTMSASREKIRFSDGKCTITSKLIEGNYPDYHRVIPDTSNGSTVKVMRDDMRAAIERVLVVAQKSTMTKLEFDEDLKIWTNNNELGSATEEIDTDTDGEAFTYGLNGRYLVEAISQIQGDDLVMRFAGTETAVTLQAIDSGEAADLILIMPMRVI